MRMMLWGMVTVIIFGMLIGSAHAAEPQDVRRIYFTIDRADILPASQRVLHEVAELLRANPGRMLYLVGHTCDLASNEYNRALARRRADNALAHLITVEGISRDRVVENSFGEEQPRYPNNNESNRAMNRRVVLSLAELAAPGAGGAGGSAPEQPFTAAVLLLDISNSTNPYDLRAAVHQFLSLANPLTRYQDYRLSRESGTRLYDAIARSCSGHMASQLRPRYLIIFSDGKEEVPVGGVDLANARTLDQAVDAANANGVRLITVELGPTTGPGRRALQGLAYRTGGRALVWNHELGADQFDNIYRLTGSAHPGDAGTLTLVRKSR